MPEIIFTNFFSISTLTGCIFFLSTGAFFLLAIPRPSAGAKYLGIAFLFSSVLAFPYMLAHAVYHPDAAYHRWMTVTGAVLNPVFFAQFFYHFPNGRPARWKKIVLLVQLAISAGLILYFVSATLDAPRIYNFNGHYWNFDARGPSLIIGVAILLTQLHVGFAGITAVKRSESLRERLIVATMTLATLMAAVIPAMANIASRQNRIEYELSTTILILMSVLGFSLVIVLFINLTRDRTTFMAKIVGASFALFLVMLIFICSQAFADREAAYDAVRQEQSARLIVDPGYAKDIKDLRYLIARDADGRVTTRYAAPNQPAPPENVAEWIAAEPESMNQRRYLSHPESGEHFTAFQSTPRAASDTAALPVYQAVYDYRAYRNFIHAVGVRYTIILLTVSFIILVGFRFFFLGALINPLQRLLDGLGRVRAGESDVKIPVGVKDEIGYLTDSFNRMARSVKGAKQRLQKHADELEDRVRERTHELEQSLGRVQELKLQQDGDYFLTALLIKPLSANTVRSETVELDFLTEQKKKFSFRRWEEELGGDICSAHSIQLDGRDYTVFVNADAMGKSVQGAGGALVFGAVFESLMERTRIVASFKNQSPERWLKNAFIELHKVFESFDGTMLISLVLGLVEDNTGMLYFVNAEHPHPVLYSGGEAQFLGLDGMLRKLGWTLMNKPRFKIQTHQLRPGDVLLVGSDGRDDLQIAEDANGQRVINEDENLFLELVQEAQGDLNRIRESILSRGQLTDDLSLIRIVYREGEVHGDAGESNATHDTVLQARDLIRRGDYAAAESLLNAEPHGIDPEPEILKELVRLHGELKDHAKALSFAERYIELRPRDTNMIYSAGVLARRLGRPNKAADFAERVRLRSREMVPNLLNLAQAYLVLNNFERSQKILEEALSVEPDNERALRLQASVSAGRG
ncbi:MAG: SpoIIE family protein phosphatase [bacterium]|nr:SpoIIE family protein phosphatase [bacterium]